MPSRAIPSSKAGVWCLLVAASFSPLSAPAQAAKDAGAPPAEGVPAETPATAPIPPPAPGTPRIIYQGRVVPYRAAAEDQRRRPNPRPRHHRRSRTVIVPSAPATPPAPAVAPATPAEAHAAAAERYAYQYFRYEFKVGSTHYAVTALDIFPEETVEVAGWNQYRTTGEAGIEYYDNAGPKRAVRRFEIVTETRDGRIVPVDVTVK